MEYRLYSFVAHHYLSPMQCGLQTAHVVSEMSRYANSIYSDWAENDKTIIICGAGNHAGVMEAFKQLRAHNNVLCYADVYEQLPLALFLEDEQSMNRMATACGIVVPARFFNAVWNSEQQCYTPADVDADTYTPIEQEFVKYLKSFRLA
jgi:hypothetical protein